MKNTQKDQLDLLQNKTLTVALLASAGGALIGLMAAWSTMTVYGVNQTIFLLIVLAFAASHGFVGAVVGILLDQEKREKNARTSLGQTTAAQAIPAVNWPQRSNVPAEQKKEPVSIPN